MTEPAPWREVVDDALNRLKQMPGALLPILHDIQNRLSFVPSESVPVIAHALNLTRAEVHGVITFYHDFRSAPPGRHIVRICRAESCQAVGAEDLIAHAERRLGCEFHHTSPNGAVTLEPVYCLGNCALSPAVTVDQEIFGRVTPERFDSIMQEMEVTR
jgi:formate dehydrogenase subunit gamma